MMSRLATLLVASSILAGCAGAPTPQDAATPTSSASVASSSPPSKAPAPPRVLQDCAKTYALSSTAATTVDTNDYYIGGGPIPTTVSFHTDAMAEFPWLDDAQLLQNLTLRVTWNQTSDATKVLRAHYHYIFDRPPARFESASPLIIDVQTGPLDPSKRAGFVVLMPYNNQTGLGITFQSQPIRIENVQTFSDPACR